MIDVTLIDVLNENNQLRKAITELNQIHAKSLKAWDSEAGVLALTIVEWSRKYRMMVNNYQSDMANRKYEHDATAKELRDYIVALEEKNADFKRCLAAKDSEMCGLGTRLAEVCERYADRKQVIADLENKLAILQDDQASKALEVLVFNIADFSLHVDAPAVKKEDEKVEAPKEESMSVEFIPWELLSQYVNAQIIYDGKLYAVSGSKDKIFAEIVNSDGYIGAWIHNIPQWDKMVATGKMVKRPVGTY